MDGEQRYAVIDVETSGLSVRRHHVLQVGLVVVTATGEVVERFSSLLAPRHRWLFFRVGPRHIHGITRRQLRRAPPAGEVLAELARRIGDAQIVAHNAGFDTAFLGKAARRYGVDLRVEPAMCTLTMSRRLDPERLLSHRLGEVCARYGVDIERPHDALSDADATAAILPHLLRATAARAAPTDQA